jgi:hypothetical protein
MNNVAELTVKFDILGLRTLSVVYDVCKQTGIDISKVDLNSELIYQNLQSINTPQGLFQIEADTNFRVCQKVKPKNLEELSNKCKMLIMQRDSLYRSINLIPKYNLPKDMLLDQLDEKEKNDLEFIPIMPTTEESTEEPRTVKPWDFLNPNTEYVDEETSTERYSICKGCPEFINLSKQCKKCGCFMSAKTKLAAASCPIGRW